MPSLEDLYRLHVGKKSDKWISYLEFYDKMLNARRNQPIRILEIGIQNGGSLEIWAKYFPEAVTIVGCDINDKCRHLVFDDQRISIVVGDVNDPRVVSEIRSHSEAFDVIIDDGSHRSGDIIKTFSLYFPFVAERGLYIAEDLHCSYWKEFEGGIEDEASSLSFFRRLIDYLNYEHWGCAVQPLDMLSYFSEHWGARFSMEDLSKIGEITFRNSLVAISKNPVNKNILGIRVIAGSTNSVTELSPKLHGTMLRAPSQETNPLGPHSTRRELVHQNSRDIGSGLALNKVPSLQISNENAPLRKTDNQLPCRGQKIEIFSAKRQKHYSKQAVNFLSFSLLTFLSLITRYLSIRLSDRYKRSAEKRRPSRIPHRN